MTKRRLCMSALSAAIALIAVVVYLLLAQSAHSQAPVAYSYFEGLQPNDLQNVQAKLSFVGLTEKPVWSVGVTTTGQAFDLSQFLPFERVASDYPGDQFELITCQVTTTELASLIAAAGAVPDVGDGPNDPDPSLAFSLVQHQQGGDSGFEAAVNAGRGGDLLTALIDALPAGSDCGRVLRQFSASTGERPGIISGDANCSGGIDIMDPLNILQFSSEARLPNSCLVVGGVPNCDGDPGPEDAIIDLRVIAGLHVTVPDGCPLPGDLIQP